MAALIEEDRYFDLDGLSRYSGFSVRQLRRYLVDPEHPIPHHYVRVGGKERGRTLIYKREFDEWVRSFGPAPGAPPKTERTVEDRIAAAIKRARER